ncbi:alpha/beta hydrolase [Microlunatus parietis]|uniref:Alpha/beta hydrolase family protein n=1 Tax=Microlunatus parietis TaxID=682979 RepID=A0A7Y9IAL5_9ACTN|nr:alpha/beta hydrolase [Microlunatus parietis]NYE73150.1 hypothetical protein [Microlunatus parietis]
MRWQTEGVTAAERVGFVEQGADLLDATAPLAPRTMVIAKSLGTLAAPWATRKGYAGVWLTPLLTDPAVRRSLTIPGPPSLAVGGTADKLWDAAAVRDLRGTVLELEGADHALHHGTDWRASLGVLERTLEAVAAHLSLQLQSSGDPAQTSTR